LFTYLLFYKIIIKVKFIFYTAKWKEQETMTNKIKIFNIIQIIRFITVNYRNMLTETSTKNQTIQGFFNKWYKGTQIDGISNKKYKVK